MKYLFLLVCLTGMHLYVSAQDPESYEKVYVKTYLETSHTDFNKALKIADSLYEHSETETYKVRSLMLTASLYEQAVDLSRAVEYAEKAKDIIFQTDNYNWQARVAGFLSTQYRLLKLYKKSSEHADKAMAAARQISNPELANVNMGMMYQEQACVARDQKQYRKMIELAHNAQKHFNLGRKNLDFFTAGNEEFIGEAHIGLKQYDSALVHFQKGLKALEKMPENFVTGFIMTGIATSYIELGKLDEAKRYLDSAQAMVDHSNNLQLKLEVYEAVKKYASKVKDVEKINQAQQVQDTIRTEMTVRKNAFLNQTVNGLETNYKKEAKQGSYKNILILAALIILAGTMTYVVVTKRQQKARFRKVLARLKEREEHRLALAAQAVPAVEVHQFAEPIPAVGEEGQKEPDGPMMTPETMQKLLQSLDEFEAGTLFTDRNMSLSYLATHINTNTKYLSRVINQHKQKDFNGYINELRVNYIIVQLNSDPVWRKYKISTLADEAGFSSHSKFATVFKSITGLSPSLFIQYLEKEVQS
ncbi:helix-turn-helix domain-containing protein [Edaphocola aurantiacus]|uniref:helix-turn-helix domain-containing protein n=1 Tax=Edaphocola aurantiacus TaxID=2601682 RepID=UPI001C96463A|nr:helix-turn-helix domain-containing protein [Edaphocola aurantiacus]